MGGSEEIITKKVGLAKAMKYCAYQERSHFDVRKKLEEWKLEPEEIDEILAELILENFLNESRFAEAFVRGRFRIKNWGKNKIRKYLEAKDVSSACINEALAEIDEDEYFQVLQKEIDKKVRLTSQQFSFQGKGKIANYLIQKGWESHLVWSAINDLENDK